MERQRDCFMTGLPLFNMFYQNIVRRQYGVHIKIYIKFLELTDQEYIIIWTVNLTKI